jgi:hypothetical protein
MTETEFSGHTSHAAEPEPSLYFPATHSRHIPPSSPVAPTLHLQSDTNAEACDEFELGGQGWQVGLPLVDHVPASQGWHVSFPVAPFAAENSPPPHAEHSYRSRLS